jgi:hypothetical protein
MIAALLLDTKMPRSIFLRIYKSDASVSLTVDAKTTFWVTLAFASTYNKTVRK